MKLKYLALAAGMFAAAPALADNVVSGSVTQIDGPLNAYVPSQAGLFSSIAYQQNFEGTNPNLLGANVYIATPPGVGGYYSVPTNDTSAHFAVVGPSEPGPGGASNTPSTFNTTGLSFNLVSVYWGSQDQGNVLTFLGAGGSVLGTFNGGAGQAGAESSYETYFLAPSIVGQVTGIRFASTVNAFEFDDLILGTAAVPEPASWALMIAGVGMIGGALRRRSREKVSVKFATA